MSCRGKNAGLGTGKVLFHSSFSVPLAKVSQSLSPTNRWHYPPCEAFRNPLGEVCEAFYKKRLASEALPVLTLRLDVLVQQFVNLQ